MKKYRFLIILVLCLTLLVGCTGNTTTGTTTASTTMTTESTAPAWPGYVDHKTEYTYFHTEDREVKWEEDVLYFANSLMEEHPLLRNRQFLIEMPNYETDARNFYDEALRQQFVEEINRLIPELGELTDEEIYYRLQWIVSLFDDVHTRLEYYGEEYFPIMFMNFYEYGKAVFYAVAMDEAYEDVLYARLDTVNGYTVEEVAEMIYPYTCMETTYGLVDYLGKGGLGASYLSDVSMLEAAGVLKLGDREVTYTLTDQNGKTHTVTAGVADDNIQWVGQFYYTANYIPFAAYDTDNYWLTEDLMPDTLYIRISSFSPEPEESYKQFADSIFQCYRAHGKYHKVIVDLRCNGGGSQGTGFDVMIREMVRLECDEFYVLVDGSSYSMATIFAGELVARRDDAILAGTPAGEAAGFFAGIYSEDYMLPNCGVELTIPTGYYQPFPAGEDNLIIPELLIYPTLSDYKNSYDTVLYGVLFR